MMTMVRNSADVALRVGLGIENRGRIEGTVGLWKSMECFIK